MTENEIGTIVVDTAVAVHRRLGPGLLESVYERVMAHELKKRGLFVETQVPIALTYDDLHIPHAYNADLILNRKVVVELKSVERSPPVHRKQTQTYLRLTGYKLGYLLNFGEALMREGIVRCVNGLGEDGKLAPSR
jgi:GxxExxY protein